MKRQKKVFNNRELCHVWASQSQDEGRNSSDSLYFEGSSIYSYGRHYLAARIHEVGGKNIVLINSHNYSPTTAKHLCDIRSAVSHLDLCYAENPSDLESAIEYLQDRIVNDLFDSLSRLKFYDSNNTDGFRYIKSDLDDLNKLCDLLNKPESKIEIPSDLWAVFEDHRNSRIEREKELNAVGSARWLKKEAERKQAEEYEKRRKKEYTKKLSQWLKGENVRIWGRSFNSTYHIRVKGDLIETTGGANVPLAQGLKLLSLIESSNAVDGEKVGVYEFNRIENNVVHIGCHAINLHHAKAVLKPYVQNLRIA